MNSDTGDLLRRAFVRAQVVGRQVVPPGRRASELGVLATVDAVGPLSQRRLGEMLSVNRSVMVKIVDLLERDGLLLRERDPADRRNYALSITATGRATVAEMLTAAARGEAELTAVLTRAERDRLVELLGILVPDLEPRIPTKLTRLSGFLIPRAHLRARAARAAGLAEIGLASHQLDVLTAVAARQPCSQRQLADALEVSGPAVVATLADLEHKGLIGRERNPDDRREHLLTLTDAGRQSLGAAQAIAKKATELLARQIGGTQVAELNSLLAKITS